VVSGPKPGSAGGEEKRAALRVTVLELEIWDFKEGLKNPTIFQKMMDNGSLFHTIVEH
jgi:hypothetical protein